LGHLDFGGFQVPEISQGGGGIDPGTGLHGRSPDGPDHHCAWLVVGNVQGLDLPELEQLEPVVGMAELPGDQPGLDQGFGLQVDVFGCGGQLQRGRPATIFDTSDWDCLVRRAITR
jgi:hypothetical protein